jgi:hypothetical protein
LEGYHSPVADGARWWRQKCAIGDADHGRDDTYHGTVGQGSIEELADKVARESRLPDINLLEMDQKTGWAD